MWALKAIGADPEFFLRDKGRLPVPAIGLIGGTKYEPRFINDDGFSAVQEDNVMVEFNIKPARSAKEFAENIALVMTHLTTDLVRRGFQIAVVPSMKFFPHQLKHPQAMTIGCEPDWNAWTDRQNPRVSVEKLENIRVSGGHVHISYEFNQAKPTPESQLELVRWCDLFLGVPSVLLDTDTVRRQFYGKAGNFRPKLYGVEYRTLSNFWIASQETCQWVFSQIQAMIARMNEGKQLSTVDCWDIREIINRNNSNLAARFMKKHNLALPGNYHHAL